MTIADVKHQFKQTNKTKNKILKTIHHEKMSDLFALSCLVHINLTSTCCHALKTQK